MGELFLDGGRRGRGILMGSMKMGKQ